MCDLLKRRLRWRPAGDLSDLRDKCPVGSDQSAYPSSEKDPGVHSQQVREFVDLFSEFIIDVKRFINQGRMLQYLHRLTLSCNRRFYCLDYRTFY